MPSPSVSGIGHPLYLAIPGTSGQASSSSAIPSPSRSGQPFKEARPFTFTNRGDLYGWHQGENGLWYYTVFVENGRVLDDEKLAMKSALLEVAKTGKCNFLFTATQNMIISDVKEEDKAAIHSILEAFKIIEHTEALHVIDVNSGYKSVSNNQ